jgi:hypothetical protein
MSKHGIVYEKLKVESGKLKNTTLWIEFGDDFGAIILVHGNKDDAGFDDQVLVRPAFHFKTDAGAAHFDIVRPKVHNVSFFDRIHKMNLAEFERDHVIFVCVLMGKYRSRLIHPRHHVAAEKSSAQTDVARHAQFGINLDSHVISTASFCRLRKIPAYSGDRDKLQLADRVRQMPPNDVQR